MVYRDLRYYRVVIRMLIFQSISPIAYMEIHANRVDVTQGAISTTGGVTFYVTLIFF